MEELRRYGAPIADLIQLIERHAGTGGRSLRTFAHVRAALSYSDKSFKNVLAIVKLYQPKRVTNVQQEYDVGSLLEESINTDEFVNALHACAAGTGLKIARATVPLQERGNYEMKGSGNAYTGALPCYLIDVPSKEGQPVQDWYRPLLRYSLPPYTGMDDAVRHWFPSMSFAGQSDGRLGHILIAVPLRAPHFGEIRVENHELRLKVTGSKNPRIEFKVISRHGLTTMVRGSRKVTALPTTVSLDEEIDDVTCWLLDHQSNVVDFFSEDRFSCSRIRRVIHAAPTTGRTESEILRQVRRGESGTLELKPFVRVDDPKAEEIVHTAVAFSNASGGDLYLGVNNRCEIDGVEKDAFKSYRMESKVRVGSSRDAIERYCQDLRMLLSERGLPSLQVHVESIPLSGHVVVRIRVEESKEKPVAESRTGDMLIRRGASNGKLNAAELEIIRATSHRPDLGGAGIFGTNPLGI